MDPLIVISAVFILFFLFFALALGQWHPRSGRDIVGRSARDDEAEAQLAKDDAAQMIAARDDIRRRRGLRAISDDLEPELKRKPE